MDATTSGTLYFDDFESRRFSYIGTLPDPGVDDPQASNQAGWFARTYTYSASRPHAVTSVNPETGSSDTYEYDLNGNMTCRVESGVVYTHTYNAENRAASIAKRNTNCTGTIIESWSFAYDGDGVRVLTAHFTGTQGTPDSTTSYYMGGAYEVKDSAVKKYYSIAGMMVAMKDASGLQYLLTDHLGSTVAVTNSSGTLTSQQRYLPFGAPRTIPNSPILGTDFTYTGQRMLDSGMGGIMDYKARFYSPALGRFQQPDTIVPNPTNPQNWNRFSYVGNRPVNYSDPTGHCATADCSDPRDYDDCWTYLGTDEFGNSLYGRNAFCQVYAYEEQQVTFVSILTEQLTQVEVLPGIKIVMASNGTTQEEDENETSVLSGTSGTGAPSTGAKGASNILENKKNGDQFRDEIAEELRLLGYDVETEVYKRTPHGGRYVDGEVSSGGKVLFGYEAKFGTGRRTALQKLKDLYLLMEENYHVILINKAK